MRSKMMHISSRAGVAGTAATCVLVAGSIALAPAASASTATTSEQTPPCPAQTVCLYWNPGFDQELMFQPIFPISDFSLYSGGYVDNNASSIRNNTDQQIELYVDPHFKGDNIVLGPGQEVSDLAKPVDLDNKLSSLNIGRV
jgi:hypothetical protein